MKPIYRLSLLISHELFRGMTVALILAGALGCTPATHESGGLSSAPERTQVTLCSDCEDAGDGEGTVSSGASPSPSPSPTESSSPVATTTVSKDCPEGEYIYDLALKSDDQGITDIGFKCATEAVASLNRRGILRNSAWVSARSSAVFRGKTQVSSGIRLAAAGPGGAIALGSGSLASTTWLIGRSASGSSNTIHTGATSDDKITSITFNYRHSRFCGVESVFVESTRSTAVVDSCESLSSTITRFQKNRSVSCDNDDSGKLIGGFNAELDEEGHIVSLNARTWIAGFARGFVATDCETTLVDETIL